jgi:beta-glucosidase
MKKLAVFLLLVSFNILLKAQDYPFQDVSLSEDARIKNLISLMTLDEKINCLSTRISVPRLGVKGARTIEGLHGLPLLSLRP